MAKFSFHFSMGNSTVGTIGLCARVQADDKKEALEILKKRLWEFVGTDQEHELWSDGADGYCCVYISPENMTEDMIDEQEEI